MQRNPRDRSLHKLCQIPVSNGTAPKYEVADSSTDHALQLINAKSDNWGTSWYCDTRFANSTITGTAATHNQNEVDWDTARTKAQLKAAQLRFQLELSARKQGAIACSVNLWINIPIPQIIPQRNLRRLVRVPSDTITPTSPGIPLLY